MFLWHGCLCDSSCIWGATQNFFPGDMTIKSTVLLYPWTELKSTSNIYKPIAYNSWVCDVYLTSFLSYFVFWRDVKWCETQDRSMAPAPRLSRRSAAFVTAWRRWSNGAGGRRRRRPVWAARHWKMATAVCKEVELEKVRTESDEWWLMSSLCWLEVGSGWIMILFYVSNSCQDLVLKDVKLNSLPGEHNCFTPSFFPRLQWNLWITSLTVAAATSA